MIQMIKTKNIAFTIERRNWYRDTKEKYRSIKKYGTKR